MTGFQRGQWVLGRYRGGAFYFPGVSQGTVGGLVTIGYDDGDRESLPEDQVKTYDWDVGSRIHAIWSGNGQWYDATIVDIHPNGANIRVRFDDGIEEETLTARCRAPV